MAVYDLSEAALKDIDRLYEYGILNFGLNQANKYYDALFAHFQQLTETPQFVPRC